MRRLLTILFLSVSLILNAQRFIPQQIYSSNYRAVWGFGRLSNVNDITTYGHIGTSAAWKGYGLNINWAQIETSDGVFNWTSFDSRVAAIKSAGLKIMVGVEVSPSVATPAWLLTIVGSFTTTRDTYPKYYNPTYLNRFYRMLRTFAAHINSVGGISSWEIVEGTTGDVEAWHGTLTSGIGDPYVPQQPTNATWEAFRSTNWDSSNADLALVHNTSIHMVINPGNNFLDYDNVISRFPTAWMKHGDPTHNYSVSGQAFWKLITPVLLRGETDATAEVSGLKDTFETAVISVATGLGIWNIQNTLTRPLEFFNRYANDTTATISSNAFIALGALLSMDSTTRWSTGTFGAYPSNVTNYNAAVAAINSNPNYGQAYKYNQIVATNNQFTSNTRETNLTNSNGIGAINNLGSTTPADNDFALSGTYNWGLYITQNNTIATCIPQYRGGSDTTIYGRFYAKMIAGQDLSFDIDDNWYYQSRSGYVSFSIVYFDNNTDTWIVKADTGSGLTTVATTTNTNTGKWLVKTFTVTNMQLHKQEDFTIHSNGAAQDAFNLIELGYSQTLP